MTRNTKSQMKLEMLASTLRKADKPLTLTDVRKIMKCGTKQEVMSRMQVYNHLQNLVADNPEFQRVHVDSHKGTPVPHYVWLPDGAARVSLQDVMQEIADETVRHQERMTELLIKLQGLGVSA